MDISILASLISAVVLSWIFFNSASSKAFAFQNYASFLERLFGASRAPAILLSASVITLEAALAIGLLLQPFYYFSLIVSFGLLTIFSALAVIKRNEWKGCSCFGPTTGASTWADTIVRNLLLSCVCLMGFIANPFPQFNLLGFGLVILAAFIFWLIPLGLLIRERLYVRTLLVRKES